MRKTLLTFSSGAGVALLVFAWLYLANGWMFPWQMSQARAIVKACKLDASTQFPIPTSTNEAGVMFDMTEKSEEQNQLIAKELLKNCSRTFIGTAVSLQDSFATSSDGLIENRKKNANKDYYTDLRFKVDGRIYDVTWVEFKKFLNRP